MKKENKLSEEQQKFYDIKNFSDYNVVGEDIDYAVIIDDTKKEVILQFKESDSREDWKNNFDFLPKKISFFGKSVYTTRGYARAYDSGRNDFMFDFTNACIANDGYKTVIRGWSFGSAMAKLSAIHFIELGFVLDELTTFGDVKCFLNPFLKLENVKQSRQYVTPNDFVTWCVPFYSRTDKCKVGEKFSLKKIFKTEYYHTHYEEYDYNKYEKE